MNRDEIHSWLDGESGTEISAADRALAERYRKAVERLERARVSAPAGFASRVVASLPAMERLSCMDWLRTWIPGRRQWAVPALAGALATVLFLFGFWRSPAPAESQVVKVQFQVHAPGARQVDLLGDFNHWTPGAIRLKGPDPSGHWTAVVDLPEGRYEYQFLVDGRTWVTDPEAVTHRPDGFGRQNAVVDVCEERG